MKFACPSCGEPTRAIKPVTLHSLLTKAARTQVASLDGFRFCPSATCDLLYTQPETQTVLSADAVVVPVFQKSTSATRLVCYCFDHSVNEITEEVERSGDSQVVQSITDKCRKGEDLCEETNPQGSCCLGNVRAVVRKAKGAALPPSDSVSPEAACCGSSGEAEPYREPTE